MVNILLWHYSWKMQILDECIFHIIYWLTNFLHSIRILKFYNIWYISVYRLTAFVAKTFQEARFGEWEKDMFIPIELLNKIALYLCSQQNNVTGEFMESKAPIYDRTYVSCIIHRLLPHFEGGTKCWKLFICLLKVALQIKKTNQLGNSDILLLHSNHF